MFKGERNRRIKDSGISVDECADKITSTLQKYKNKRIVFSNTWGYTNELKDELKKVKYENFMLNDGDWLDRALDGEHGHAGPKTHDQFVKNIHKFIKEK